MKYKTIVIDPPWKYGIWGSGSKKALVQGEANKPAPLPYEWISVGLKRTTLVAMLKLQNPNKTKLKYYE